MVEIDEIIEIKYLIQGTITVSKPLKWDEYSLESKAEFATIVLNSADDAMIVDGMRTTGTWDKDLWDEGIEPQAIRDPSNDEVEYGIATPMWLTWAYSDIDDSVLHSITPRTHTESIRDDDIPISRARRWVGNIISIVVKFFKGLFNDKKKNSK